MNGLAFDPAALINSLFQGGVILVGIAGFMFLMKSDIRSIREGAARFEKEVREDVASLARQIDALHNNGFARKEDMVRVERTVTDLEKRLEASRDRQHELAGKVWDLILKKHLTEGGSA